jgi:hypothetical protein
LLFTRIANYVRLVDFAAVGASCDDAVSTDENSLHKFQAARRHRTAFVASVGRSARGRAVGSGGSPINHPLTNCRTGRFARNIGSARPGRAVFLPAVFLRERRLPQCGLRKKDPAGSARAAEARNRGNGDYGVYYEILVGEVNGSAADFHFRHRRKAICVCQLVSHSNQRLISNIVKLYCRMIIVINILATE